MLEVEEMKLFFYFLIFVSTICHRGYGDTVHSGSHPAQTVNSTDASNQTTQAPKNYLDIKVDDKEGDRFFSEFINMLMTLGLIVAIILIATWFLKKMVSSRMEQMNTTSIIKVVEKRMLTPRTSIYLIDVKGDGFILAESNNGVTSLGTFNFNKAEEKHSL